MSLRWHRLLPVFLITASLLAAEDSSADEFDSVRGLIRHKLEQKEAPSIAVAVVRSREIVWEEGFGWADKEHARAASHVTSYSLGSVSKPITATAVMVAHLRGLLKLDRPINDYLGETKLRAAIGDDSAATVQRVVQHMAGLPEFSDAYYRDEPGQAPSLEVAISRYGLLTRPPGELFIYSNFGYALLGSVISRVSGKAYGDFLHDEVFVPLGMRNAAAPGPLLSVERAVGYHPDGTRVVEFTRIDVPAAKLYASAHDLARFGLFHLKAHLTDQRPILSDEVIDEMQQMTVPMGNAAYGLGWHIRSDAMGRRQVLHGGALDGTDVQFTLVPEQKLCVVVLANVTRHFPGAVTEAITNSILAKLLGGEPGDFPINMPAPPPKISGLPGKLEGRWAGNVHTYEGLVDVSLWCDRSGAVEVQLGKGDRTAVREGRLNGDAFAGKMDGHVETDDARRRTHELDWDATIRGDVLNGTLYATAKATNRPLRLGHWVELRRVPPGH
jgi:CubicO group peptidase (beta-lactamase class C family)